MRARLGFGTLMAAFIVTSCGGGTGSTPATTATAAPGTPAATTAAASAAAELPVINSGSTLAITPGTYRSGADGFFPGLTLTVPAGWETGEADSGELKLYRTDHPDDVLLLWKDLVAVEPNNQKGKVGQPLVGVGHSRDELIEWIKKTPDFAVLDGPATVKVAGSIEGIQLTVGTSPTANFAEPGCPANPRCSAYFTDSNHWPPGEFWGIGGDEVGRVFIATVHYADGDHTFFVTLDVPNKAELATFGPAADAIVNSLQLPPTFTSN